jgi:hypothetical protein
LQLSLRPGKLISATLTFFLIKVIFKLSVKEGSFRILISIYLFRFVYHISDQVNMALLRFLKRRLSFLGLVFIATIFWIFYLILSAPAASGNYFNALSSISLLLI